MTPFPALPRLVRLMVTVLVGAVIAPHTAGAQTAARVVADRPSTSGETRRQSDSLTVHFLRTPKAKPNARAGAAQGTAAHKVAGDTSASVARTPASTPLPTRSRKPKH